MERSDRQLSQTSSSSSCTLSSTDPDAELFIHKILHKHHRDDLTSVQTHADPVRSSVTDLYGCELAVAALQAVSLLVEGGDVHRSDHGALSLTSLSRTFPLTGSTHTRRQTE